MADKVQARLEALVPAFVDLKAKKLFSKAEIRAIIRRRRDFEYRCASPGVTKADFLDYIQYETALETLRKHRCAEGGWKDHTTLASCGVPHILQLFKRMVSLWPQDVALWNQYIDFSLRSGATKRALAVLMKALAYHPRELNFWVIAAQRELQFAHVEAPRRLLQLALRQVPDSAHLWEYYFRFEMQCVIQLASAKTPLGTTLENAQHVGTRHLGLILRAGLEKLSHDADREMFLVACLDMFATLLTATKDSCFVRDLDCLEEDLQASLERLAAQRPSLYFLVWRYLLLGQQKERPAKAGGIETLSTLMAPLVEALHSEEMWWCLVLCVASLVLLDTPPSKALFSLQPSVEDTCNSSATTDTTLAPRATADPIPYNPVCPALASYVSTHAVLLHRLLIISFTSPFIVSLFPALKSMAPTTKLDLAVSRRLEKQREALRTRLETCWAATNDPTALNAPSTNTAVEVASWREGVCHWLVDLCASSLPMSWAPKVFPLVFKLLEELRLLMSTESLEKRLRALIQNVPETTLNECTPDTAIRHIILVSLTSTESCRDQFHHKLNSLLKLSRQRQTPVSQATVDQVIMITRQACATHEREPTNGETIKMGHAMPRAPKRQRRTMLEEESLPSHLTERLDALYHAAASELLFPTLQALLQHVLCFDDQRSGFARLRCEVKRVSQRSFCPSLQPIEREVIRRVFTLTHLVLCVRTLLETLTTTALCHEQLPMVSRFIELLDQSVAFDASTAAVMTPNAELLPPLYTTESLVSILVSIALCLDGALMTQGLVETIFRKLSPMLRNRPSLSRQLGILTAKRRTMTMDEARRQLAADITVVLRSVGLAT